MVLPVLISSGMMSRGHLVDSREFMEIGRWQLSMRRLLHNKLFSDEETVFVVCPKAEDSKN